LNFSRVIGNFIEQSTGCYEIFLAKAKKVRSFFAVSLVLTDRGHLQDCPSGPVGTITVGASCRVFLFDTAFVFNHSARFIGSDPHQPGKSPFL
jgi:hypothetical protein